MKVRLNKEEIPEHLIKYFKPVDPYPHSGQFILRNIVVWHKPNHMPASVKDRFTNAYEPVFMLVKSRRYYFDLDAVRVPFKDSKIKRVMQDVGNQRGGEKQRMLRGEGSGNASRCAEMVKSVAFNIRVRDAQRGRLEEKWGNKYKASAKEIAEYDEKNYRKSLNVPGQNPHGIHRRRHSGHCGANGEYLVNPMGKNPGDVWTITITPFKEAHFAVFPEKLVEPMIKSGCPPDGLVLDPFCGSGTTCVVAAKLGRHFIGVDIKKEYCEMARKRLKMSSQ